MASFGLGRHSTPTTDQSFPGESDGGSRPSQVVLAYMNSGVGGAYGAKTSPFYRL